MEMAAREALFGGQTGLPEPKFKASWEAMNGSKE
jgi:hypothetical protein